jgi:hypothetical protein
MSISQTPTRELSEKEQQALDMFDEQIKKDSEYITPFEDGETRTYIFDLSGLKIGANKKFIGKIDYIMPVLESEELGWKKWTMSKRTAQDAVKELRRGFKVLQCTRDGIGTETRYIFRPVS